MADSQSAVMHILSLSVQVLLTSDEAGGKTCVRALGSKIYTCLLCNMPVIQQCCWGSRVRLHRYLPNHTPSACCFMCFKWQPAWLSTETTAELLQLKFPACPEVFFLPTSSGTNRWLLHCALRVTWLFHKFSLIFKVWPLFLSVMVTLYSPEQLLRSWNTLMSLQQTWQVG